MGHERMGEPALAARTRHWAFAMTLQESVTASEGEARFPVWLKAEIEGTPAFSCCTTFLLPVEGDALGRACTGLLVKGEGAGTVVLSGHLDTVAIEDYGEFRAWACDPEGLAPRLVERLRRTSNPSDAERRALADLESGAFIPGRGLLDMKAGLAAGLAVCERHAADPGRRGNLLLLAVPDEEASSAGMRQVARSLGGFAREHGLDLLAAINLDSIADDGDGSAGQSIALGSIGKLLLTAFVVGRPAHACYPLAGVNAGALAGAIAAEAEWASELADESRGVSGTAATLLSLKDSKSHYDVTTPAYVFATWNALTFGRPPAELLAAFGAVCRRALDGVARRLGERGRSALEPVPIIDLATLRETAFAARPDAKAAYAAEARRLSELPLSLPEQCRVLTEHLLMASGMAGPLVVVGFGSMPYLPVALSASPRASRLAIAAEQAARSSRVPVSTISHFPGISDLSFLGEADLSSVPAIAANTPVFGHAVDWPAEGAVAGIPSINAGPWGRDYHTPLERLHAGYAFEVLPGLIEDIAQRLLMG